MRSIRCSSLRAALAKASCGIAAGVTVLAFTLAAGCSGDEPATGAGTVPEISADPGEPVTVLAGDSGTSIAALRHRLISEPDNGVLAAQLAAMAMREFAKRGQTRFVGYAQTALEPWSNDAAPSLDIWRLRGRIAQSLHRFAAAAEDLDCLLAAHPGDVEALLLSADAWRRAGRIDLARQRCFSLGLSGHHALARLCAADILSTLGRGEDAYRIASQTMASARDRLPPDTSAWGGSVLGDAAFASGRLEEARVAYESALSATVSPTLSTGLALADVLLELRDFEAVRQLLDALPPCDAVLLREARLAAATGDPSAPELSARLGRGFELNAPTADAELHLREQAMFELHVLGNGVRALELASRNWQLQKGWEDAALLSKAAAATGDTRTLQALAAWRREQGEST